jgi:hypothetical protein
VPPTDAAASQFAAMARSGRDPRFSPTKSQNRKISLVFGVRAEHSCPFAAGIASPCAMLPHPETHPDDDGNISK